jgi:hypothetical protein
MTVHLEAESAPDWEGDEPTKVTAYCGATGTISADGTVDPPDFDFVLSPDVRGRCTCVPCLARRALGQWGRE